MNDAEVERGDLPIDGEFTVGYRLRGVTPGKVYVRIPSRDWLRSSAYHVWFENDLGEVDWIAADNVTALNPPKPGVNVDPLEDALVAMMRQGAIERDHGGWYSCAIDSPGINVSGNYVQLEAEQLAALDALWKKYDL